MAHQQDQQVETGPRSRLTAETGALSYLSKPSALRVEPEPGPATVRRTRAPFSSTSQTIVTCSSLFILAPIQPGKHRVTLVPGVHNVGV